MKRGVIFAVVGVLFLAGLGAAGLGVKQWHATHVLCDRATANAEAAPTEVPGPGPLIAVIGDSWTSGWELDHPDRSYAYVLARQGGWAAHIDGFSNSGWTNASWCGDEAFASRVSKVPADAHVVLIEGGLNDTDGVKTLLAAARDTLAAVAARAPAAKIIVVGPPAAPARDRADLDAVDAALVAASRDRGAVYVRTMDWPLDLQGDALHLTEKGHADFARRLLDAIGQAARSDS